MTFELKDMGIPIFRECGDTVEPSRTASTPSTEQCLYRISDLRCTMRMVSGILHNELERLMDLTAHLTS